LGSEISTLEDLVVPKRKALIFDLDGTLVDSKDQIGSALNRARELFDFNPLSDQKIEELIGLPIDFFLEDLGLSTQKSLEIIAEFRRTLQISINDGNKLFAGAFEFISLSKDKGYKTGIATSKPTYLAELVIVNSDLNNLIDVIQGTDGFPAKPDPTSIQKAMMRLDTENAIMIGDRIEDIQAAKAAGIESIGIAQSFHNKELLRDAGAKLAFDSFIELLNSDELDKLLID
jgi:HAD superfamily hydrolase (TIGR01549 family)